MLVALSEQVAIDFAKKTKIEVLPLAAYNKLDVPVASHADMLLCVIDKNIFCYDEYYCENIELFKKIENSYNIIRIKKQCAKKYPNDVSLNVLVIGNTIFTKTSSTAKEIIDYATTNGYKIVDVKQGYSACSTLVINNTTAITTDSGIHKALINEGYKALLVTSNCIELKGYNCGFIGGAGGVIGKTVYFFGDISLHPDYQKISSLLLEEKYEICSILSGGVYDFGGIKCFQTLKNQ